MISDIPIMCHSEYSEVTEKSPTMPTSPAHADNELSERIRWPAIEIKTWNQWQFS